MQFDFLDKLQEIAKKTVENAVEEINRKDIEISNSDGNISETEIELAYKLDAVEEFSIDRFEGNIAILEDRKSGDKINIDKNSLPKDIKEGDIVKKINGKYILDFQRTANESKRIRDKMNDLWK